MLLDDENDGSFVVFNGKRINHAKLSAECWPVQIDGIEACKDCDFRDKDDCDGEGVRTTGKNEKGYTVPV